MPKVVRKIRFVVSAFAVVAVGAGTARGAQEMTPFGLVDSSCIVRVPNGANLDVATGDIIQDGVRIGHHERCVTSIAPSANFAIPQQAGNTYAYSVARATLISGLQQYDKMEATWTIPANPSGAPSVQFLWAGLQNSTGPCPTCALIQPVLQWGEGPGTPAWNIASWAVYGRNTDGTGCTFATTPFNAGTFTAGDPIRGILTQIDGAPNHPQWDVVVEDDSNPPSISELKITFPSAWPKFTYALSSVFEGDPTTLTSCSQLSPTGSVTFALVNLSAAGPVWNSFNNVLPGQPSAPSWGIGGTSNPPPSCNWQTSILYSGLDSIVSWQRSS